MDDTYLATSWEDANSALSTDDDILALFARARQGDQEAISRVVRLYETEVRMIVRSQLPRVLRSRFDSMDFVQAVWISVLSKRGRELRFENPRHLIGYLAGVARNKVNQEHRRQTTRKHDIGRETPLYTRRGGREIPRELKSSDPSPSQTAQAGDRLDQMTQGGGELVKKVIELRQTDMTYEEIGRELGFHESVIRRMVDQIKRREERR